MPSAPAAFIDPALLAKISDLALLARTVVDGFMHGQHRSLRKGTSLDFAEHRSYQPGDDLRRIDWRVFGRTDRFYVKEYDADTNAAVVFALDASGSMDYGSESVSKFDYARFLIASLAWLSQSQGDRVGLACFANELLDVVPPSARHLQLLLHTLGRAKATGEGNTSAALQRVAHVTTRSGIVVIVSDCYEAASTLGASIDSLRMAGHDVILFHIIDPAERDFSFEAPATFEDAETGALLPLKPEALRSKYVELFASHRREVERRTVASGADYIQLTTNEPLDKALHAYLDRRLSTGRIR